MCLTKHGRLKELPEAGQRIHVEPTNEFPPTADGMLLLEEQIIELKTFNWMESNNSSYFVFDLYYAA